MSQLSCDAIRDVLSRHFTRVGVTIVNDEPDLEILLTTKPDLVFLGMEFVPSDSLSDPSEIWLSSVLDNHGIASTGSEQAAHELGRYKHLAKQRVREAGLRTADFCVIERTQTLDKSDVVLDFPLFVKPVNRGGGLGIDSNSLVYTFDQLHSKVYSIRTAYGSDALIEEYLSGREFSVAILKETSTDNLSVMPLELVAPPDEYGSRVLSGHVKAANTEQALPILDPAIKSKVTEFALNVFGALGARDYGRIDIRLDAAGRPHFLEVNLIPSLISGYGSFPKACVMNIGLEYEPMILRIANLGLARSAAHSQTPLHQEDIVSWKI